MTVKPPDVSLHHHHILALIGICHWVKPTTPIVQVTNACDRFLSLDALHIDRAICASGKSQQVQDINLDIKPKQQEYENTSLPPKQIDKTPKHKIGDLLPNKQQNCPTPPTMPTISYVLDGVRVGNWVLIVDMGLIGHDEQQIWTSLKSALSTWAAAQKTLFLVDTICYPMNETLGSSPALAQKCLDGFIARLLMADDTAPDMLKTAFLSDLNESVDYFGELANLPNLYQMKQDAMTKKILWQAVTA